MKLAVTSAAVGLSLLQCVAAKAGGVQVGLVDGEDFEKWICGAEAPSNQSQRRECENAKFEETSPCPIVVITNSSTETVKVQLQITGPGFERSEKGYGGMVVLRSCKERPTDPSCDAVAPGQSCYENIEFSPRQSGLSDGHIEIRVTGSGDPIAKTYDLVATADYPPDLLAADEVRKRHQDELMRIPHVVKVSLDHTAGDILINVEVAHEEDIPKVQRSVPPKIEGYRVEVIEKINHAWLL